MCRDWATARFERRELRRRPPDAAQRASHQRVHARLRRAMALLIRGPCVSRRRVPALRCTAEEALHRVRDTRLTYAAALCLAISAWYSANSSASALATLGRLRIRSR